MIANPISLILLTPVIIVSLYFLLKYPEISFALFINAYVLKGGINIGYFNLTAILLIITVLGFFLPLSMGKKYNFKIQKADIWLLIFVIVLLITCFISPNIQDGLIKIVRFIVIVLLPYILARIFLKNYIQIHRFIMAIYISALTISVLLIINSFSDMYTGGRIIFFEANQIPIATLLATGLVIAVIGAINNLFDYWEYGKLFYIITITPLLYSMFLVGVRGPLISIVLGLFFYLIITFNRNKKISFTISVILFFIVIVWMTNFNIIYSIMGKVPNISSYSFEQIKEGISAKERLDLYSSAITLFIQKPLLGVGVSGFPGGYPHNIFLEIAAENGIIGLIIFICFLFAIMRKGFWYLMSYFPKLDKQSKINGLITLTLCFSLFIGKQFSYGLDMNKDLFVFFGLVVNLSLIKPRNKEDKIPKEGNKYGL